MEPKDRLIGIREAGHITGKSRRIYEELRDPESKFPRPVKDGRLTRSASVSVKPTWQLCSTRGSPREQSPSNPDLIPVTLPAILLAAILNSRIARGRSR